MMLDDEQLSAFGGTIDGGQVEGVLIYWEVRVGRKLDIFLRMESAF